MRTILSGLDFGTNEIKLVIAEFLNGEMSILTSIEEQSQGIKNGLIIDEEAVVKILKNMLKKVEDDLGIKLSKTIVNISAKNTEFIIGKATIDIIEAKISSQDVSSVVKKTLKNEVPVNMDVINVVPTIYKLDNSEWTTKPIGKSSSTLSVKTVITVSPKEYVASMMKVLLKSGLKLIDVFLNGGADYYALKEKMEEACIGAVVNIGELSTSIALFNKGIQTNSCTLDIGSRSIDNDLAFVFKLNFNDARMVKEKLALANKRYATSEEVYEIANSLGEKIKLNQYETSEIAMARIKEILELIKKEITLLTKQEISYIILTGGLSEMRDFALTVESVFGQKARVGFIQTLGVRNAKYSTVAGMIKGFYERLQSKNKEFSIWTEEEMAIISTIDKKVLKENSLMSKVFGYFFDN